MWVRYASHSSLFSNIFYHYKLRERKVKTLTRNWRDHKRTGTHKHTETVSRYFDWHGRQCQPKYLDTVSVCFCVPIPLWSLQFLVRVFTFLSLNLWFSYFGTFLSTWSIFYRYLHIQVNEVLCYKPIPTIYRISLLQTSWKLLQITVMTADSAGREIK